VADGVRLGLIGAGRCGRVYIRTIAAVEGVRLSRVASGNPDTAKLVPAGCAVDREWRKILDRQEIDGVIVAAPPAMHAEMIHAAVEAGLPVLVEKPLTLDLASAREVRSTVERHGGFVMVGHTHLFHPAYRKLKEIAPRHGEIRDIQSNAGNLGPYRKDTPVLWDWGPHDIAMCLDLLGVMPQAVRARSIERRAVEGATAEIIELSLDFEGARQARCRFGNLLPKQRRLAVHLGAAVLVYDDLAPRKLTRHPITPRFADPEGEGEPIEISAELPLNNLVSEFAAAIRARKKDLSSLDLGIKVVEVLERCSSALESV
jgi:predicted dehydrogenase